MILGRGSLTESFPLFGLPLDQYQTLFEVERGSLYLGSAETVARKIARTVRVLEPARFQLK